MMERRTKRSEDQVEALQCLLEAVADRSEVRAVALVDARGAIVAGTGTGRDLRGLARIAHAAARGQDFVDVGHVTKGTDVLATPVRAGGRDFVLAALGERVRRMPDAQRGVTRILSAVTM